MTPYNELRAALAEEFNEPGHITRQELAALLARFPERPDDEPPPAPPHDGLLRLG